VSQQGKLDERIGVAADAFGKGTLEIDMAADQLAEAASAAAGAINNVGVLQQKQRRYYEAAISFENAHEMDPNRGFGLNFDRAFSGMRNTAFGYFCQDVSKYWASLEKEEERPLFCLPGEDGKPRPARILIFGDSHARVWPYMNHKTRSRTFDVCISYGATALGLANEQSSTGTALLFENKLKQAAAAETAAAAGGTGGVYDGVGLMAGEIDCGCGIWRRSAAYGTRVEEQMRQSVNAVFTFLAKVAKHYPPEKILLIGVPLPVINTTAMWQESMRDKYCLDLGARLTSKEERTSRTLQVGDMPSWLAMPAVGDMPSWLAMPVERESISLM
jgi:hypothetical protein